MPSHKCTERIFVLHVSWMRPDGPVIACGRNLWNKPVVQPKGSRADYGGLRILASCGRQQNKSQEGSNQSRRYPEYEPDLDSFLELLEPFFQITVEEDPAAKASLRTCLLP